MLARTYPQQICSVARALEVVGERWTLLILRDAFLGASRFEEFRESLGIATNVLTTRLEHLCEEGVLERRVGAAGPSRPEYVLTPKGRALGPALLALMKWGDAHYAGEHGPPRLTLHRGCGGAVDETFRCAGCGTPVPFEEVELHPGPGLTAPARFEQRA